MVDFYFFAARPRCFPRGKHRGKSSVDFFATTQRDQFHDHAYLQFVLTGESKDAHTFTSFGFFCNPNTNVKQKGQPQAAIPHQS